MSSFHPSFSSFPDFEENGIDKERPATAEHTSRKGKGKRPRNKDKEEDKDNRGSSDRHYRSRHGESRHEHGSRRRRSRSKSPERKISKYDSKKSTKDHPWKLLEDDERQKARQDQTLQLENDAATPVGSSKMYFVDKRGDTLNITYGGLHQGDVPKFYRDGKGRVLGLPSAWRVSRGSGNREVEVGRRDKRKAPRYTDSKSLKALVEGPRRLLLAPKASLTTYGEFIPLSKVKMLEDADPKDSYRSIVAEPPPDSDPELEQESGRSKTSNSGEEEFEGTTLPAEQEKMKSLEETLRRSPQDEQSWLHLISISIESITNRTKRGVKAKAEIATSILKRALDAHRNNEMLPRLRLLYVTYGEEFWDDEKTRRSWNSLLSDFSGQEVPPWKQALARMAFLDWTLANKTTIAEALADARKVLAQLQDPEFEMARARIIWRTAVFLREAGFWEQAMAILQAQIELAFFCPPQLASRSLQDRIDSLEDFWDSEVPRFSEDHAQGWAQWVVSGRPESKSLQRQPSGIAEIQDPYQQWCYQERALDTVGAFPTKSFTEDESDPYSTILFSDIRGFISDFKSSEAQKYLSLVFLSFLGLNIPGIGETSALLGSTGQDDLLENGWMVSGQSGWPSKPGNLFPPRSSQQQITWESHVGVAIATEQPRKSGFGPVKEWVMGRSFFEGIDSSCTGRTWEATDTYGVHIGAVRNAMDQLPNDLPSLSWEDMKTALDAAVDLKSTVKASKQRLESRQSDIGLWRTHIKLESIKSDPTKVAKMYTTLLATSSDDPDQLLLYSDAVEHQWLQESEQTAIQLLKKALGIDQETKGAIYLLRGRNSLGTLLSTHQEWDTRRVAALHLQFFFNLNTGTLEDAISTFNQVVDAQSTPADMKELLYIWISTTVFRLSQRRGTIVPPPVISALVSKAVQLFPNNTVLLGLFLECERGQGIWGGVRRFLAQDTDGTSISQSIKRIAWNVWAEGWSYGPWEPERVRSRLETALDLKGNKGSVVLWQVYIVLEMEVENLERAKRVLLRALGVCWWAKELYLMAFGPLRAVFSARELNDIVAAMVDRGIRMRRDIQEQLEGWIDPSAIEDDEHAGDMEVETLLQGREQAKPY